uniref:DNA-directed RNA polymerase M/15kDa subunit domain-containing protein n=1 Tax=viral metagenome TaxID=1070528 RepID=A0A6C0J109_9ZZZZ
MKFCEQCDNMYYISINEDDPNKLEHFCRNCKNIDNTIMQDGGCILNVQTKNEEQHFNRIINKYTKHDPTLPRIYNMKCPNNNCKSNKNTPSTNPEVVYMRYNDADMKYLYICTDCDNSWKTDQII